jgi:TRAP-type C4-dicarboxylate transport system substrate-binding protein
MSVNRSILVSSATAVTVAVLAAGCGSGGLDKAGAKTPAKPVTLHMVTPIGAEELQPFIAAVKQLSGGTVRITLEDKWHVGQPGAEQESIRYVQSGKADLGGAPVRAWDGVGVRSFDAMIAPLVVDTYALQGRVLSSDLVAPMLGGTKKLGLTGLGVQPGPMRKPVGNRRLLVAASDYRGTKLAMGGSEVASRTFAALGALGTPFAFEGRSIALFDGSEQQVSSVEGNQYDGVARSITANVNLWPRPVVLFGNEAALARLTEAQRTALRQAAKQVVAPLGQKAMSDESEAAANLCRRGRLQLVSATTQQITGLRAATEPVRTWLRTDEVTKHVLDGVEALRAQLAGDEPELAPSCDGVTAGAAPRPKTAGPLDGVFVQTTTPKDLEAVGVHESNPDPANFGRYVWVIDRGRFAFTQTNGTECSYGYGSWAVKAQTVELLFSGGGAEGSSASNKPGEFFTFGWSAFRDTVTFSAVAGRVSPENFFAKPWKRLSRTPTFGALGHRCLPPKTAFAG